VAVLDPSAPHCEEGGWPAIAGKADPGASVELDNTVEAQIPGVGPVLPAVFVAEIGDITRFDRPARLASWAGLTPKHHESDTTVHRGRITKQGSRLVRWAAVEAVQRVGAQTALGQVRDQVGARRGRNIGVVAAARELTELVFYGMRDGHIRRLAPPPSRTPAA
jgi:transposase